MQLKCRIVSVVLIFALWSTSILPLHAAQEQVTISLAVPDFQESLFDEDLLSPFEAQTGIKVHVVNAGFPNFPFAAAGVESHLDTIETYVNKADVVFVNQNSISPEATRAGYYLNLAPLAQSDPALNPEDFFPAAWESFRWDQGLWALPVSIDLTTLNYNPEAFDRAGIPYPNEQWTMDDLAYAARTLTEYDEDGEVVIPGVQTTNPDLTLLLRSLLGHGLYDDSTIPETPDLTDPALEPLLETWLELEAEGVSTGPDGEFVIALGDDNPVPMRIEQSNALATTDEENFKSVGTLLPGGMAGLRVQGFAVSGGTTQPEAAYQLVKYLSNSPQVADSFFSLLPARQSLVGLEGSEQGFFGFSTRFTPETEAFLNDAVWRALPVSELRYSDYLALAVTKMRLGMDARTALQEVELEAVENLRFAEARRDTAVIAVATPMATTDLAAGEISINFGYQSFISPLSNQEQWDQVIAQFVQQDPEVGRLIFDTATEFTATNMAEEYDCFFLPYNDAPNVDPESVYNLDPFIDADPSFDPNDVVGNVLSQMQRDNKTWALPIIIQPSILRYNPERFTRAGLNPPEDGWTIDAFVDALKALKIYPEDPPPFVPNTLSGGTYMLMLIAAYGGVPIDYRTEPPTIAFTDPANVDATRQVLDLARDGYIDYSALGGLGSGEALMVQLSQDQVSEDDAIYPDSLDIFGFNMGDFSQFGFGGGANTDDRRTTYPYGNIYSPASYTINTAYISANAENPQACYRWLSFFSSHPELFTGMPARRSLLNDPLLIAAQGEEQVAFYREYDTYLTKPNTIIFPTYGPSIGGVGNFFIQQWLFRAFDNYVLKEMDLETELAEAELFAKAYQECEAQIPPFDPMVNDSPGEYLSQFFDCATLIDPSFEDLFGDNE